MYLRSAALPLFFLGFSIFYFDFSRLDFDLILNSLRFFC